MNFICMLFICFDILASSLEMLHTDCIRKLNGGQYPLSILLSAEAGKSQGKSSTGQVLCWSTSDIFGHTIDSSVDKNAVKKFSSGTSLPTRIEDVESSSRDILKSLAMFRYDEGVSYKIKEVRSFKYSNNCLVLMHITKKEYNKALLGFFMDFI